MVIAFITGSLAPGKSGVGDYTYLLAAECAKKGVVCCLVSLSDSVDADDDTTDPGAIPVLRMQSARTWADKVESVRAFLVRHEVTHVSIQFVAYAYHPKGIVKGVGKRLADMCGDLPIHLMFHELWIGAYLGASLKDRVIGLLQRYFIVGLIHRLSPQVVHSSNPVYNCLLNGQGVRASQLSLFGHVPIPRKTNLDWLYAELQNCNVHIRGGNRGDFWIFGMFGTLHPVWQPEPFMSHVHSAARSAGKQVIIVSGGRIGAAGNELWRRMTVRYREFCIFHQLGERSLQELGDFFQFIDFGVAATPWALIGKSSAVATMVEHGVPVIVTRDDARFSFRWNDRGHSPLLIKMTPDLSEILPDLRRATATPRLPLVAEEFLSQLKASTSSVVR